MPHCFKHEIKDDKIITNRIFNLDKSIHRNGLTISNKSQNQSQNHYVIKKLQN